MRTYSKIIALAFILMMVVTPIVAIGSTEGAANVGNVTINNFDDMSGGSIEVTIIGEPQHQYHLEVKDGPKDNSSVYTEQNVTTGDDGKATAKLSWNFNSPGNKIVFIFIDGKCADGGIQIYSNHSIWKDPLTYVAIVVVIILIIVAVYIKMRGVPGSKKDKKKKTFTEIEAERLEKEKSGEKKSFFAKKSENSPAVVDDTTSTEKQSYTPGKGFFRKKQ